MTMGSNSQKLEQLTIQHKNEQGTLEISISDTETLSNLPGISISHLTRIITDTQTLHQSFSLKGVLYTFHVI